MSLLAHAGHVLVDLLYALPLVVMVGILLVGRLRERRACGRRTDRGLRMGGSGTSAVR
jgi:hypothetical protein